MEKIVLKRLCQFVHAEHLLPDNQFAFRPHHSTEDAITVAVDSLLTATDHSQPCGLVLVDMGKAFDKVNQEAMVKELHDIGIGLVALDWFVDYLSGRHQREAGQCIGACTLLPSHKERSAVQITSADSDVC